MIPLIVTAMLSGVVGEDRPVELSRIRETNSRVERLGKAGSLRVDFRPADWPNVMVTAKTAWDWSAAGGLALDVRNPGSQPVELGVRVDDDPGADGRVHCRQGMGSVGPGQTARFVLPLVTVDPMTVGMRGLPVEAKGLTALSNSYGKLQLDHVIGFQVFLHRPTQPTTLILERIRLTAYSVSLDGIVDRFGQYSRGRWPGKVRREEELLERRQAEEREIQKAPALPGFDRYGGWSDGPLLAATGFFRTEKVDGKWWLVTPEGRLFFSLGMDCLGDHGKTIVTGREKMFSWLPAKDSPLARFFGNASGVHSGPVKGGPTFDFLAANLCRKYGEEHEKAWLDRSLDRLRAWGFNTAGNWSDWALYGNGRVPYVATVHIEGDHTRVTSGQDHWGTMHDPFDPRFAASVRRSLAAVAKAAKADDPWCLGWFVDNEISWGEGDDDRAHYGLALGALAMNADASPAKRALLSLLRKEHGDIGRLRSAWGVSLSDWEALEAPFRLETFNDAVRRDLSAYLRELARTYFHTVRDELKAVAPNHLYLGCRFASSTTEAIESAAKVCDVVSFNIYENGIPAERAAFYSSLDRPCIIGEFHFGALDRGMFHTGLVATAGQEERAEAYVAYVRSVLDHPAFVGCHWFQYHDEPITGRWFDGENYNIGFVTITDTPYPEMVAAARKVHADAYPRRFGGRRG